MGCVFRNTSRYTVTSGKLNHACGSKPHDPVGHAGFPEGRVNLAGEDKFVLRLIHATTPCSIACGLWMDSADAKLPVKNRKLASAMDWIFIMNLFSFVVVFLKSPICRGLAVSVI